MAEGGIFQGVIVHTHPLPGRHLYADATQIAHLRAFDWLTGDLPGQPP